MIVEYLMAGLWPDGKVEVGGGNTKGLTREHQQADVISPVLIKSIFYCRYFLFLDARHLTWGLVKVVTVVCETMRKTHSG